MKISISLIIFALAISVIFVQCNKKSTGVSQTPKLPEVSYNYQVSTVKGSNNTPSSNQLTDAGATLGRVLFYDKKLSINNATACGSCHLQSNGFADISSQSNGFEGVRTSRNSSTIANVINQTDYFWDGRTKGLEEMVLQPIRHQVEMGMEKPTILPKKLSTVPYYSELFKNAFGDSEITPERISKALAQFLRSMTSYNSLAEQTNLLNNWGSTNDNRITDGQKRGAQLFVNNGCTNCHSGNNFRGWDDQQEANIGLEMNYTDKGKGEFGSGMEGVFKVPSLRNVALTAPYMHDGRFKTLKEVVNHYNSEVVDHPNLSPMLRNNAWGIGDNKPRKLNMSDSDMNDLVDFLSTLTDATICSSPKFSNPFEQ